MLCADSSHPRLRISFPSCPFRIQPHEQYNLSPRLYPHSSRLQVYSNPRPHCAQTALFVSLVALDNSQSASLRRLRFAGITLIAKHLLPNYAQASIRALPGIIPRAGTHLAGDGVQRPA